MSFSSNSTQISTQNSTQILAEQVQLLQRRINRLQTAIGVFALIACSFLLYGATESGKFIRTQGLEITDAQGNPKLRISGQEHIGGVVSLYDQAGRRVLVLRSDEHGGVVENFNEDGRSTFLLNNGQGEGGKLSLSNENALLRIAFGIDAKDAGLVSIFNQEQQMSHFIGTHPRSKNGMMMVSNQQGTPQSLLTSSKIGGQLIHFDSKGKPTKP